MMTGEPDITLQVPVPEVGGAAFNVTDEAHTV
jgi:hypothetical protein